MYLFPFDKEIAFVVKALPMQKQLCGTVAINFLKQYIYKDNSHRNGTSV